MVVMTKEELKKIEDYFYLAGYKHWYPFPQELKVELLKVYGEEPFPHYWTEQDIFEGSRKIITAYFSRNSH